MKKIRPGYANITYIYPEDIIKAGLKILICLGVWKALELYEFIKPYLEG